MFDFLLESDLQLVPGSIILSLEITEHTNKVLTYRWTDRRAVC